MMVYDAHAHVREIKEALLRQRLGIQTMLSAGTPDQARRAFEISDQYPVHRVTAGLHPWQTGDFSPDCMDEFMERTPLIGEIGMDSLWCNVPLDVQKRAFIHQLDVARRMKKPVVLHTKDCEREIAQILEGYPELVLVVHWYSGSPAHLKPYLERNCYFTIGPSVGVDPVVAHVAQNVPQDRMLFETDGMDAVRWAIGETPLERLENVLTDSVNIAARLRGEDPQRLADAANGNFLRLINS